jgi:hypothetical protein
VSSRRHPLPSWCRALTLILVGAAALSVLAMYNGYPFFFFDTHAYYTAGEKALDAVLELACDGGLGCAAALGRGPGPR